MARTRLTVWHDLLIPDNQRRDWYGWLTNQAGHALLVGFPLAWAAGFILPASIIPLSVALTYFIIWELLIQRSRDVEDSLMDTLNVLAGASILSGTHSLTLPIWYALLFAGSYTRWRRQHHGK